MIYIIQPLGYNTLFPKALQTCLRKKYPSRTVTIKPGYSSNRQPTATNAYFVINDPALSTWDGLQISQTIRLNEPRAILILASTDLDYLKFFRSHIRFLGVIDLNHINLSEIESYLDDTIKLTATVWDKKG